MSTEYVYGPYKHGKRWRIVLAISNGGERQTSYETFATEAEAREFRCAAEREIAEASDAEALRAQAAEHQRRADMLAAEAERRDGRGLTVSDALDQYGRFMLDEKGNKQSSVTTTLHRLRAFMVKGDATLAGITPRRANELYGLRRQRTKADTHRNELSECKTFFNWCVEQRWIRANPFAEVKPMGKRRRGKTQLRIDETKRLVDRALDQACWSDAEARGWVRRCHRKSALAVLVALYLGLRASEVVNIRRRDVDDGGRLLWIPDSKTEAGKRTLKVPRVLQALLLSQADRARERADERLFPHNRGWVRNNVRRLCELVDVPMITAHGLRGTHATLAAEIGTTPEAVALALGHTSARVTTQHYIAPGTIEGAAQERIADILGHAESRELCSDLETEDPKTVSKAKNPARGRLPGRAFVNDSDNLLWS